MFVTVLTPEGAQQGALTGDDVITLLADEISNWEAAIHRDHTDGQSEGAGGVAGDHLVHSTMFVRFEGVTQARARELAREWAAAHCIAVAQIDTREA